MILLTTLLVFLLAALATIVVRVIFNPTWPWLNRVIATFLVISLALGVVTVVGSATYNSAAEKIQEQYDTIMLYYDTIDNSRNEYVRFDFYQRVKDYNAEYAACQELNGNIWIGAFLPRGWDSEIGLIDFMLRTGSENGVYGNETFDGDVVG